MREVHRFIADEIYQSDRFEPWSQRIKARKLAPTGRKVAVAGAGPTGLTAAFYLAMLGHDVTIFEERSEAGGMLRFAIPEYRLPKSVLRRELDLIEAHGRKDRLQHARRLRPSAQRTGQQPSTPSSSPSEPGRSPGSTCPAPS